MGKHQKPHITITGRGRASAPAEITIVKLHLRSLHKDQATVWRFAIDALSQAQSLLKGLHFTDDDMTTDNISVKTKTKRVERRCNGTTEYEDEFIGYEATQTQTVKFPFESDRLLELLNTISDGDVNALISVGFTVKDPEALQDEVLRDATETAMRRAKIITETAGASLGKLLSVTYAWRNIYFEREERSYLASTVACYEAPTFKPQDIEVEEDITFKWELVENRD